MLLRARVFDDMAGAEQARFRRSGEAVIQFLPAVFSVMKVRDDEMRKWQLCDSADGADGADGDL